VGGFKDGIELGGSGRGRFPRPRLLLACAIAALSLCAAPAAAPAATPAAVAGFPNLTGTWQTTYHCEVGWCEGQAFYGTADLSQARGSDVITGSNEIETISGTLNGHTLEWASGVGDYLAEGTMKVGFFGLKWSGTLEDSNGTSGTFTATRETGPICTLLELLKTKAQCLKVL
jgi:hypothetical protein